MAVSEARDIYQALVVLGPAALAFGAVPGRVGQQTCLVDSGLACSNNYLCCMSVAPVKLGAVGPLIIPPGACYECCINIGRRIGNLSCGHFSRPLGAFSEYACLVGVCAASVWLRNGRPR